MAHWWEIQVRCPLALEDSVYWRFETVDGRGTVSQQQGENRLIRSYFPQAQFVPSELAELAEQIQADARRADIPTKPQIDWQLIPEEDWAHSWKSHWQPQPIGRFMVNPAWLSPPATEQIVLQLDPGSAFGTGAHATTQLCLEGLSLQPGVKGATLADIGCGSGILSIGAVLLGASQIHSVDVDPLAITATRRNSELNGLTEAQITVAQGSIEQLIKTLEQPVDGILCNILAEVIIQLIPQFNRITHPDSWGLLSGILGAQAANVTRVLVANGWQVTGSRSQAEWCCLAISRTVL
ncbi:50S ribosomal protein L11 methyltransferase [Romeria aff. gracilis LEGE 07310]|uniref:Ribosomal protein L11 methyltransferase n=1 Tax=Vasconcelosia minhoensis LEGE 07310 TaxID=915328 RepID=A0A8J7AJS1_9CYAN|nr:50S ribosomal protein L11 methyltransferase [Romeria gracilis]MBE9076650.1 50S ribosomal protein L11 methyltransferase [Romeria aff. gracilis LEGE 07310]